MHNSDLEFLIFINMNISLNIKYCVLVYVSKL